jgi:glucose dehydrogenase
LPIIAGVVLLIGEWVPAWLGLSATFLVAGLGVVGLGWWVLRKDKMNRAAEEAELAAADSQPKEIHH